ncbi:hypothetical protein M426DRAFT_16613 [Hypoxylon sp. CI-4A]|nr:hypothetical protein M426DRAFT_16613 [Hypoxylon sp. CI-4A]
MANGSFDKPVRPVAKKSVVTRLTKTVPKAAAKIERKLNHLTRRELWTKEDPAHTVDWTDKRVWEKINNEGCYHRADEMLVSCGTVTIDKAESTQPKVLVVYNRNIGIYQLPKGRKNFDEGYLDTALRETAEETGVAARSLRLRFGSRSTPPRTQVQTLARTSKYGMEDKLTGITEGLSNEYIGTSECSLTSLYVPNNSLVISLILCPDYQYVSDPDPATGAWRHIYWYAAKPLGDIIRDESRMTEEEDRKKFTTFWFPEDQALRHLKLEDEKFMVRITFAYIRNMSVGDWESNREYEKWENSKGTAAASGINHAGF